MRAGLIGVFVGVLAGWVIGTVWPIEIWYGADCHRMGGAIRVAPGPGKALECVIPWTDLAQNDIRR